MKVILFGSTGQLGKDIIKTAPKYIELISPSRQELDLINPEECYKFTTFHNPDWVINSAAFTNVDKAEIEKDKAMKINALSPKFIAKGVEDTGGKLLHISTDYVFDGKQNFPYKTNQTIRPINFYGRSKAEGEQNIKKIIQKNNDLCIIRTSWLMSSNGNNFATKILKLLSKRELIKVVYDQIGSPTTTLTLAKAIWDTIKTNISFSRENKIFPRVNHFCNDGVASWYDIATEIQEIGLNSGLLNSKSKIIPIATKDFPTPASRPKYSVLDSIETKKLIKSESIHWRNAIQKAFKPI